uniref:Transposase Tc1-like domain-containing protein n=1 Tax=Amphiprion ocellaris TaxID=80972 RepID=A0AAQ5X1D5_AMPOC
MGKSRDLSEFERGMIVGARSAGCSISQTVNLLGFSKTAVSRVYREWCERQKTSSHRGSCGRKRLVDESGERRMERMVEANNQATSVQIQALYNSSGPEKPISLTTTRRTLKRLGYSRATPRRDALIVAGLEALAVYASCSQQLDTSADFGSDNKHDSEPQTESSTDLRCSNDPITWM